MTHQRRALRVPCNLPARVFGRDADVRGTVLDISRMGLRLHVDLAALGCLDGDDLLRLGRVVEQHFGARFNVDLDHEALGQLVRKRLHVVRLGQERGREGTLELGCSFTEPLSDDETRVLDLDLPPMGTPPPPPVLTGPTARRQYEAYLLPTEGYGGRMLPGRTTGLSDTRATFRANPNQGLDLSDREVSTMAMALAREYGPAPVLEIVDGNHQLWAGEARVRHVAAAPSEPHALQLDVETFQKGG